MIKFLAGNLFDAQTEAIVNAVNTVGVMGKGIALTFKETFPANFHAYKAASERKEVRIGHMFTTENPSPDGPRWIINFPTKEHWRNPSKLEWITEGLQDLRRVVEEKQIRSIAVPALGCGNGGLQWSEVRPEIESAFAQMTDLDVLVFEPIENSKPLIQVPAHF